MSHELRLEMNLPELGDMTAEPQSMICEKFAKGTSSREMCTIAQFSKRERHAFG